MKWSNKRILLNLQKCYYIYKTVDILMMSSYWQKLLTISIWTNSMNLIFYLILLYELYEFDMVSSN